MCSGGKTGVQMLQFEKWRAQDLQIRDADDPAQLRLHKANCRIGELSIEVKLLHARCEKQGLSVGWRSHL
jgi:hypothetical protein